MRQVLYRGIEVDLDPDTFENLGHGFARDAHRVLYEGEPLADLDPKGVACAGDYVWDGERVFHQRPRFFGGGMRDVDEPIDADPATFVVLDGFDRVFGRDKDALFLCGTKLDLPRDAVPQSATLFKVAPDRWVYWNGAEREALEHVTRVEGDFVVTRDAVFLASRSLKALSLDPKRVMLAGSYAWDDDSVYFESHPLKFADAASFEVLEGPVARDKENVWVRGNGDEVPDPSRIELCCVGGGFADGVETRSCEAILKDESAVYFAMFYDSDYSFSSRIEPLANADPASYRVLDPTIGLAVDRGGAWLGTERIGGPDAIDAFPGGYWRIGDRWHHGTTRLRQVSPGEHDLRGSYSAFTVIDRGPVRFLGHDVCADRAQVWHAGHAIPIEPVGVESLGFGFLRLQSGIAYYAEVMTSRKVVTYESLGGLVEGADVGTFEVLNEDYGADATRVFCGTRATAIDRESIRLLGGGWARDDRAVYCYGRPVKARLESFRVLGGSRINRYAGGDHASYATDGETVFRGGRPLASEYSMREVPIEAATFKVLSESFGTDGSRVVDLSGPTWIEDVDAASFKVLQEHWGRDERVLVWVGGRWPAVVEDVDLATIEAIDAAYAVDATRVYASGKPSEIDRKSFRSLGHGWAVDDKRAYAWGQATDVLDFATLDASPLAPALVQDDRAVYLYGHAVAQVERARTRSLDNECHWIGNGVLYARDQKIGPAVDVEVLGPRVVRNGGAVYYEDVELR